MVAHYSGESSVVHPCPSSLSPCSLAFRIHPECRWHRPRIPRSNTKACKDFDHYKCCTDRRSAKKMQNVSNRCKHSIPRFVSRAGGQFVSPPNIPLTYQFGHTLVLCPTQCIYPKVYAIGQGARHQYLRIAYRAGEVCLFLSTPTPPCLDGRSGRETSRILLLRKMVLIPHYADTASALTDFANAYWFPLIYSCDVLPK